MRENVIEIYKGETGLGRYIAGRIFFLAVRVQNQGLQSENAGKDILYQDENKNILRLVSGEPMEFSITEVCGKVHEGDGQIFKQKKKYFGTFEEQIDGSGNGLENNDGAGLKGQFPYKCFVIKN